MELLGGGLPSALGCLGLTTPLAWQHTVSEGDAQATWLTLGTLYGWATIAHKSHIHGMHGT